MTCGHHNAGGILGSLILFLSLLWPNVSAETGLVVAVAMPCVSIWANGLAALVTMGSSKLKVDPAMTAGPLVSWAGTWGQACS